MWCYINLHKLPLLFTTEFPNLLSRITPQCAHPFPENNLPIFLWDSYLKRGSKLCSHPPLWYILNTPHPSPMRISASRRVTVRGRDRVQQREYFSVSTNTHGSPSDTPGGGRMAKAFSQTMKPAATNDLPPKRTLTNRSRRKVMFPQSLKLCDCKNLFCPNKVWQQPFHHQQKG